MNRRAGRRGGRTSDNQVGSENGHTADTNAGFGGSIGSAEAGEDDGGGAAEGAEEGLSRLMLVCCYEVAVVGSGQAIGTEW